MTFTVADLAVVLFGENVTLMVQLAPTPRPTPPMGQLWVRVNRFEPAPPVVMPLILRAASPEFDTVIDCAGVVTLRAELNASAAGETDSTPEAVTVSTPGAYAIT